jgi:hypothetical protein
MTTTPPICINLAYEDELSGRVLRRLLSCHSGRYEVGVPYSGGGFGYLRKRIEGFNNAAKGVPFLVLTDLDAVECAPSLVNSWLPHGMHPNLLFRIAVREVEAWLLADREGVAEFLAIQLDMVPDAPDEILDPKGTLIDLARRSPSSDLRRSIAPPLGSTSRQGPDYNGRMSAFAERIWNPCAAAKSSSSLARTIEALTSFSPIYDFH